MYSSLLDFANYIVVVDYADTVWVNTVYASVLSVVVDCSNTTYA